MCRRYWLAVLLAVPAMGSCPAGECDITPPCGPMAWSVSSSLFYPDWSELEITSGWCSISGEEVYHSFSVYCPDGDSAPCQARDFAATECPECYTLAIKRPRPSAALAWRAR